MWESFEISGVINLDLPKKVTSFLRPESQGFASLIDLFLPSNNISDLNPLGNWAGLTRLWLNGNQIENLGPLLSNTGLDTGDKVFIEDNPLDCKDATTLQYISTLEDRGVYVDHDCDR